MPRIKTISDVRALHPERFLTTTQVGRVLGVDRSTVRDWCEASKLRAAFLGGTWRIMAGVVVEYVEANTNTTEEG